MHTTSKDSSHDGSTHLLTSTIESDNEFALCPPDTEFKGEVASIIRTISGGIEVQVLISLNRPGGGFAALAADIKGK